MFLRLMLVAALVAVGSVASADEHWVYFGTYTGKGEKDSRGIYRAKFDDATGKLGAPMLAAELDSPSFVAVHPNKKFLYAVGEGGSKTGGPVVSYTLDAKTGNLVKLNEEVSGGPGPCHLSLDATGHQLAVANYGGGSTIVFDVGEDGKIGRRTGFIQHKGSSVNKDRQGEPHAHCTQFYPQYGYLLTADLGTDRLYVFSHTAKGGLFQAVGNSDVVMPAGSGPRHFAVAPDGKFGYVCGELDSTVNVVEFGWAKGNKVIQSLSTLPKETKGNSTAECLLSPDGKFVYVSNRGHNSVAVFKVGEDRKLTAAGHVTGDIKTPRNFSLDPSGKWMLIASQDGGKVGVWERDAKTGGAKETANTAAIGKCVCVKFVPVAK